MNTTTKKYESEFILTCEDAYISTSVEMYAVALATGGLAVAVGHNGLGQRQATAVAGPKGRAIAHDERGHGGLAWAGPEGIAEAGVGGVAAAGAGGEIRLRYVKANPNGVGSRRYTLVGTVADCTPLGVGGLTPDVPYEVIMVGGTPTFSPISSQALPKIVKAA